MALKYRGCEHAKQLRLIRIPFLNKNDYHLHLS